MTNPGTKPGTEPRFDATLQQSVLKVPTDLASLIREMAQQCSIEYEEALKLLLDDPEFTQNMYDTIVANYAYFESEVSDLASSTSPDEHFLGDGSNAKAYRIFVNGIEYATRIPRRPSATNTELNDRILCGIRASGVEGLEQIVAASAETGVTIALLMNGKNLDETTIEDVEQITTEQIVKFISLLHKTKVRQLTIDYKDSNIFYDTNSGFGIIDMQPEENGAKQTLDEKLVGGLQMIANMGGLRVERNKPASSRDFAQAAKTIKSIIPICKAYIDEVKRVLVGGDYSDTLELLNSKIQELEAEGSNYTNPDWVKQHMNTPVQDPTILPTTEITDFD